MKTDHVINAILNAKGELDTYLSAIGGCGDGNCVVVRPSGQHTNGGCRCTRDFIKMQRFAFAVNSFAKSVEAAARSYQP